MRRTRRRPSTEIHAPAHAGAMGDLVKAVLGCDGSDADRVEQNIVPRVSHSCSLCHRHLSLPASLPARSLWTPHP